jgi:hypothetical protein
VHTDNFLLEIDHLLIFALEEILEVSILQEFGLCCNTQIIRRVEQGTASRVFFFENVYLEVVWLEDKERARQHAIDTGIDILARTCWQQTGASPFGIGLRCKREIDDFMPYSKIHRFRRNQLDRSIKFSQENLAHLTEPLCFTIPNHLALTTLINCSCQQHRQLIYHPLGVKKLTSTNITINGNEKLTNTISLLDRHNVLTIQRGIFPLLDLTFDNNLKQKIIDFRPILPMLINY